MIASFYIVGYKISIFQILEKVKGELSPLLLNVLLSKSVLRERSTL